MVIKIRYRDLIAKSFNDLKRNPFCLVPELIYIAIIFSMLGVYIKYYLGLDGTLIEDPDMIIDMLRRFGSFMIKSAPFIFLLASFFSSLNYGIAKDITENRKIKLSNISGYLRNFFVNVIKIKLWTAFIYIPLFLTSALFFIIFYGYNKIFAFSLGAGIFLVGHFLILLALYFKYPIMVHDHFSAIDTIRRSYGFFKVNKRFVFATFVIINAAIFFGKLTAKILELIGLHSNIVLIISGIIYVIITIWSIIYAFNSYNSRLRSNKHRRP